MGCMGWSFNLLSQFGLAEIPQVLAIDFNSSDNSCALIQDYAPASWQIIPSDTGEVFDAKKTDEQVMQLERQVPQDWVIALTTTEFLVHPYLRLDLHQRRDQFAFPTIIRYPGLSMSGNDRDPLLHFQSLVKQRHVFLERVDYIPHYGRVMHFGTSDSHRYGLGRHDYSAVGRPSRVDRIPSSGKPRSFASDAGLFGMLRELSLSDRLYTVYVCVI